MKPFDGNIRDITIYLSLINSVHTLCLWQCTKLKCSVKYRSINDDYITMCNLRNELHIRFSKRYYELSSLISSRSVKINAATNYASDGHDEVGIHIRYTSVCRHLTVKSWCDYGKVLKLNGMGIKMGKRHLFCDFLETYRITIHDLIALSVPWLNPVLSPIKYNYDRIYTAYHIPIFEYM